MLHVMAPHAEAEGEVTICAPLAAGHGTVAHLQIGGGLEGIVSSCVCSAAKVPNPYLFSLAVPPLSSVQLYMCCSLPPPHFTGDPLEKALAFMGPGNCLSPSLSKTYIHYH